MIATVRTVTYFTNNIAIHNQVPLARAVTLMGHVNAIIPLDADLIEVRCPGRVLLVPAQIIFSVDKAFVPRLPVPNKAGVYRRDRGVCAYCGKLVAFDEASMDHIVPQCRSGPTSWLNLVNACRRCNEKKADRTPEQAGMPLLFKPTLPRVRLRPE